MPTAKKKQKPAAAKKPVAAKAKKPATPKKQATPMKPGPRADLGAKIDPFFAKQPAALRPICERLRALIEAAAPDATSSIKWGMPFYEIGGATVCAIGAHKAHVNLILHGGAGTYADPDGLLEGEGKTGRHLKVTSIDELPVAQVQKWLATAVAQARK